MGLIEPDWPAPDSVRAFTTTRLLRDESSLDQALFANSRYSPIRQVHGTGVVEAGEYPEFSEADACFSRRALQACRIHTADCLPVLICNRAGNEVAAVHAGWCGLSAGVIENCLAHLESAPGELMAWLGPAISQRAFEVGEEVLSAFLSGSPPVLRESTRDCFRAGLPGKYHADLYGLARLRLEAQGISAIFGGEYCTYSQPGLFHSYRRDQTSLRMISIIVFLTPT